MLKWSSAGCEAREYDCQGEGGTGELLENACTAEKDRGFGSWNILSRVLLHCYLAAVVC